MIIILNCIISIRSFSSHANFYIVVFIIIAVVVSSGSSDYNDIKTLLSVAFIHFAAWGPSSLFQLSMKFCVRRQHTMSPAPINFIPYPNQKGRSTPSSSSLSFDANGRRAEDGFARRDVLCPPSPQGIESRPLTGARQLPVY